MIVNRDTLQADALQEPQAGQDLRDRGRPGRAGDAGRALQHPEQGGQPRLARAELRLGGRPRGQGDPGRRPGQPDQGALDGHLRRRRHPRHVRGRARSARPPRTAASGCTSRTSRSSTTRFRSAPRLHRVAAERSLPPEPPASPAARGRLMVGVAKKSVPMNTPFVCLRITAYHSVTRRCPLAPGARARRRRVRAARRPRRAGCGLRPDRLTCR